MRYRPCTRRVGMAGWSRQRSDRSEPLRRRGRDGPPGVPAGERGARGEWLVRIEDLTPLARELHATRDRGLLPPERPYPVPAGAAVRLGIS